jgi:hypothetical protein
MADNNEIRVNLLGGSKYLFRGIAKFKSCARYQSAPAQTGHAFMERHFKVILVLDDYEAAIRGDRVLPIDDGQQPHGGTADLRQGSALV